VQAVPPTSAQHRVVDQSPQIAPRAYQPRRTSPPPPRPLAPVPPPDGRDAPDPFVLADDGRYFLYSTQVGLHNVPVATSPDLGHWSPPSDALPQLPVWAEWGRTWAPGVTRLDGRYLLYFAAHHRASGRQCISVATSASADGPFVSPAPDPLVCQTHLGGSIDPHPFIDTDGAAYLLWKADGNAIGQPSTLFAQRLAHDGLTLTGQPVPLLSSDAGWEQPLIENPALVASGGSYVLLYSGGWWESAGYATGYATCDTPLGPCTKATVDRPLLASGGDQAGPGGAIVVTGPAGDHWLAYHAWTPGAVGYGNGGSRSLHFASVRWSHGWPVVAR
jgi:beta-xylosidase